LLKAGYTGPLSVEVFNDLFRQADPNRIAIAAQLSLLMLAESASVVEARDSIDISPLALAAYDFSKIAADTNTPATELPWSTSGITRCRPGGNERDVSYEIH